MGRPAHQTVDFHGGEWSLNQEEHRRKILLPPGYMSLVGLALCLINPELEAIDPLVRGHLRLRKMGANAPQVLRFHPHAHALRAPGRIRAMYSELQRDLAQHAVAAGAGQWDRPRPRAGEVVAERPYLVVADDAHHLVPIKPQAFAFKAT
ncbi:MAG: hypothetical protein ACRDGN_11980 [bacterium]